MKFGNFDSGAHFSGKNEMKLTCLTFKTLRFFFEEKQTK